MIFRLQLDQTAEISSLTNWGWTSQFINCWAGVGFYWNSGTNPSRPASADWGLLLKMMMMMMMIMMMIMMMCLLSWERHTHTHADFRGYMGTYVEYGNRVLALSGKYVNYIRNKQRCIFYVFLFCYGLSYVPWSKLATYDTGCTARYTAMT